MGKVISISKYRASRSKRVTSSTSTQADGSYQNDLFGYEAKYFSTDGHELRPNPIGLSSHENGNPVDSCDKTGKWPKT
jgi:hypothetical protein